MAMDQAPPRAAAPSGYVSSRQQAVSGLADIDRANGARPAAEPQLCEIGTRVLCMASFDSNSSERRIPC